MHQVKKGNEWHFGMKAHIGVDVESGLVHTVVGTAANVSDVTQAHALLHGEESVVFADAGYQGVEKCEENLETPVDRHVAMKRGLRKALPKTKRGKALEAMEQAKASTRAKVEHPFHVLKNLFMLRKTRYRGLAKNVAHLMTLFGLGNLMRARKRSLDLNAEGAS
jgi:IS5 family transposase